MKKLIDENFNWHAKKIAQQTEGMTVLESEHLTCIDSGLSCDTFNIIHIHSGQKFYIEELKSALDHFNSRNLEYCIWINKENLQPAVEKILAELSITCQNEEAGMVLNLDSYQLIHKQEHINVKTVDNPDLIKTYAQVIAENWNPSDQNVLRYYQRTSNQYLNESNGVSLLIYYYEDKPVSVVEMFPTDDETLGLYGFATLESYRGLGIGSTLMTFALNKAKEQGYENVILQASEDGIGIYRNYGFVEQTMYFEYA